MNIPILQTKDDLNRWRAKQKNDIHLVPTMGGLHLGHGQLIKCAKKTINSSQAPSVIVSIFVNPLQFGPQEDFDDYPRNLAKDIEIASQAGANAIWAPSQNQVFPNGPGNAQDDFRVYLTRRALLL